MRPRAQLDPRDRTLPGIGHNAGPPLEMSWEAWLWRRNHAKAWRNPPRDIVLLRIRRAERLGLSYRDYTAILLDRGTHPSALIFAPRAFDAARPTAEERARIDGLYDCRILLCLPPAVQPAALLRQKADAIDPAADAAGLVAAGRRFLRGHRLPPDAAVMIGSASWHLAAAEDLGLALFKWAGDYFRASPG